MIIWVIGLSGAGKSSFSRVVYKAMKKRAPNTVLIDGDEIRDLFRHTGPEAYTPAGRRENALRIQALCRWLDSQGINAVCAILSIFEEDRQKNRELFSAYREVYIDAPRELLEAIDYKNLYKDARAGKIANVAGVDINFPIPAQPDYTIRNNGSLADLERAASETAARLLAEIRP